MTLRAGIPETLEEATSAAWLSEALGAEVTDVAVGDIDNRVSTNAPLHVTLADGSIRRLWVKGYFSEIGRAYRFAGVPEALFYRNLADRMAMRTLRPVFAAADPASQANVVVTEDVLSEGAVFLDALSTYSVDQTAESLEQLAALHAATWLNAECGRAEWLTSRTHEYAVTRGLAEIERNLSGPIGAGVPDEVRDGQRLYDAFRAIADDVGAAQPWCVVHGDPHIGNVYLDGAGRPAFLDWQLVQRGPWYVDVGYHLASCLTVADRRRAEGDLVRHYLDRLSAAGMEVPPAAQVWRGVRRSFVYGFYLWAITLRVDPRKTAVLLERLGTAVADHDAYSDVSSDGTKPNAQEVEA